MGNPSGVKGLIPVLAHILTNRNISTIGAYQKTASIDVLYSNCRLLNIELKIWGRWGHFEDWIKKSFTLTKFLNNLSLSNSSGRLTQTHQPGTIVKHTNLQQNYNKWMQSLPSTFRLSLIAGREYRCWFLWGVFLWTENPRIVWGRQQVK
mgnify:FL=1